MMKNKIVKIDKARFDKAIDVVLEETLKELKSGCPWRYRSDGTWWCHAINVDCCEDNCAMLYWLRKTGKTE